jgi:2'-5' RNA ligase
LIIKILPDFKNCHSGKEFSPHLTIAQFSESVKNDKYKFIKKLKSQWEHVEFEVNSLQIIARNQTTKLIEIIDNVNFGKNEN